MTSILNQSSVMVPCADLIRHPRNPRRGDTDRIVQSIRDNGFYGVLIVQRSTNHVLVGNHRLDAAIILEMGEVPVIYVDVDDSRAERIMLADNRSSDAAGYDDTALLAILRDINASDEGLAGTAYTADELEAVVKRVAVDAGGEFLADEASQSTGEETAPTQNEAGERLFQVSYSVTAEERQIILTAIRAAQARWNLNLGKEALVRICNWFAEVAEEG